MISRIPSAAWNSSPDRAITTATDLVSATGKRDLLLAGRSATHERTLERPTSTRSGRVVAVAEPQGYEPNYAYPLIVWLHGTGGSANEIHSLLPELSERNYFGLAFDGQDVVSGLPAWSMTPEAVPDFASELYQTVCHLRRCRHIHSERVFVGGIEAGAVLAVRLLLHHPEWFGGAVLIGGGALPDDARLTQFKQLRGRPVMFAAGRQDRSIDADRLAATARLLHCAGMHVTARPFDAGYEVTSEMLREIDGWLIDQINRSTGV